mgnify:CR=1 FL=1
MLPLRGLLNIYTSQVESRARGNRIVRESTTLRVAEGVWADVASETGLGFKWTDAGPLLYGDLGRAVIEAGVYESKEDGSYRTVVQARIEGAPPGKLVIAPRSPANRVVSWLVKPPPGLPAELDAAFFVRATPPEVASLVGAGLAEALVANKDRAPVLDVENGACTVVLEGVEMVQERLEALLRGLGAMGDKPGEQPYREAP